MMNRYRAVAALIALCLAVVAAPLSAGQPAPAPQEGPVVILDSLGVWRMHQTLKPPVARVGGRLKPLLIGAPWVDRETAPPPAGWQQPDFDDHGWLRGAVFRPLATPYVARLCLRGKFTVTDPARVRDLKLRVGYHGAAVVYVNGRKIADADVRDAAAGLADDYPAEAFLTPDGDLLTWEAGPRRKFGAKDPRWALVARELADVSVPADALRRGVNVLAVEVLRAPYPDVVDTKKDPKASYWNLAWDTCQIDAIRLTAAAADGVVPNTARPAGFQVWNSNALATDYTQDFGDPNETLAPVRIAATRNGLFSGKVVVGADRPLRGLTAVAGDLAGPGGAAIPAENVRIRYGSPWGADAMAVAYCNFPHPYAASADMFGGLSDRAPDEVPLYTGGAVRGTPTGTPEPVPGAVAPVWITVRVPADAPPGTYTGRVSVSAQGRDAVPVPVEVRVAGWTLPDPQDYRTMVEMLQSPDTLALEYEVPMWSERHWDLIARSFRLMGPSGSRFVHVPLIAETNMGHGETMVRWIEKGQGRYDHDFSVMEKYLDTATRNLGAPKIVIFYVWDVYMLRKGDATSGNAGGRGGDPRIHNNLREMGALRDQGPVVTVLDPATGATHNKVLPKYTDPGGKALWQPLYDQLRRRLAERGLADKMMFGMMTDVWPTREQVAVLAQLGPDVPWAIHSHGGAGPTIYNTVRTGYQTRVWSTAAPGRNSLMGWKQDILLNRYFRQGTFDRYPVSTWRYMTDFAISGSQRGVGRLGADHWPVLKDNRGRRRGRAYARYPQSSWRNLNIYVSLLAPAPDGPAATQHLVHLVEGVQECEAKIVVERAVTDPALRQRLGEDLAGRCEAALLERLRNTEMLFCQMVNRLNYNPGRLSSTGGPGIAPYFWCIGSGWEDRAELMFSLAGEVERKLGPAR